MAESRDPAIRQENVSSCEGQLDREMNEDLQSVYDHCGSKDAATIYQNQTADQHMQYSQREIGRWLRGVK